MFGAFKRSFIKFFDVKENREIKEQLNVDKIMARIDKYKV